MPSQVENGKAFEYSIAHCYYNYLKANVLNYVELQEDAFLDNAKSCYDMQSVDRKLEFDTASNKTIETLIAIEPGLSIERNRNDVLKIRIAADSEGQLGDVRDIILWRPNVNPVWEIGISAKNNHDAVKHSRISPTIDFGEEWMGAQCSKTYFSEINKVFDWISMMRREIPDLKWSDLGNEKQSLVYKPLLDAFRKEMLRLTTEHPELSARLLCYLIGQKAFYKIIKEDKNNLVVVKAFNIDGKLNKTINGHKPIAKTDAIKMPSRVIELEYKNDSDTTLIMVLDEGWQISFRIHSASTLVENSLKFDIQLIGNPPILFTQHLF